MATGGLTEPEHWACAIDWTAPWLAPFRALGEPIANEVIQGHALHDALNVAASALRDGADVRFVPQGALVHGVAYESHIYATRQCPTREGLHDFFNALVWLHFPKLKTLLNQWQASAIASAGVSGKRGPLRDAITVFDENGALLVAPDAVCEALRERRWGDLFGPLRPLWRDAQLVLFGHALMEQLTRPRKPMTAHVIVQPVGQFAPDMIANYSIPTGALDGFFYKRFGPQYLSTKPFAPLPVLGVPGWWAANESAEFYDDPSVFRAVRIRTMSTG